MEKAAKIRNAVIHVDRKGVDHHGGVFPGKILFHNVLTDKQVKNINKALGTSMEYRDMVVVVDLTAFGSCKDCIVFTREGLYATSVYLSERLNKKSKLPMPVRYDQLQIPSVATTWDIASSNPSHYMRLRFADGKKPVVYMGCYAPFVVLALRNILKELESELPPQPPVEIVGPGAAPKAAQTPKAAAETPKAVEAPKPVAAPKPMVEAPKPVETPKSVVEAPKPAAVRKSPETAEFDLEAALKRFKETFVLPVKKEMQPEPQPQTPPAAEAKAGPDTKFMLERGLKFFREKDYEQAFPRLLVAAEAEHQEAWLPVAQMYYNGWGTKQDKPKALIWYLLANDYREDEDNFLPIAQMLNEAGAYETALKYAKKAGKHAPKESRELTGEIYERWAMAKYVEENEKAAAMDMFRKAVECGNGRAALALSMAYEEGKYLPKDDAAAVKMLMKAAEKGEPAAFRRLGGRYYEGDGVPKSMDDAIRCFREGAKRGDGDCAYNLAVIYNNQERYSDALSYVKTAKKLGNEDAEALLQRIRRRM